jgi:hypothetical protein
MGIQNVLGVNYPYPDEGDKPWGVEHIDWATAVSDATNTLEAQVDNIVNVDIPALQAQINLSGEANTSSNSGTGQGLALPKVGVDLPFKSLVAGTGVGITSGVDTLTINATSSGDVTGPIVSIDGNIATYNGATGKIIKLSGVNIDGTDTITGIAGTDAASAGVFWDAVSRPNSAAPGLRGIAISAESGAVTETTTTPQDIGVTATLVTTGRPVFVGLTCDASVGIIRGTPDNSGTSYYPFTVILELYRDATKIYESRQGVTELGGGSIAPFDIAPGSVWTIDTPAAGTYVYTFRFAPSSAVGTSQAEIDNLKIIAYEL